METEQKVNILLVDDHPPNLLALEAILQNLDLNLVKANSGEEALKCVLRQEFAVILLDVQMPGLDGFETAMLIRERPTSQHTPIIFVTAISKTDSFVFKGYSVGAVDYLFKPIVPEILISKLAVFVDLYKKNKQVQRQAMQLEIANKELQQQLEKISHLNQQLETSNQELKTFSYSLTHDLRNPLCVIKSFNYLLGVKYAQVLDEAGLHYIDQIEKNSDRMAALIEDMLRLAQVTAGIMCYAEVDLTELVEIIREQLQYAQPQRKAEFVIMPEVVVKGDEGLLKIALENLLGNAWKFTSKQPFTKIEFGIVQKEGQQVFFVRDNGAGFDMNEADKLFTPFKRLHSLHEFSGTGVGLAITERIISRHGGKIWAESAVEQGAVFYFTLENLGFNLHSGTQIDSSRPLIINSG